MFCVGAFDTVSHRFCRDIDPIFRQSILIIPLLFYASLFILGYVVDSHFAKSWIPLPSLLIGHSRFRGWYRIFSWMSLIVVSMVCRFSIQISLGAGLFCLSGGLLHIAMAYYTINDNIAWHLVLHFACLLCFILFFYKIEIILQKPKSVVFLGVWIIYVIATSYAILAGGCLALNVAAIVGYIFISSLIIYFCLVIDALSKFECDGDSAPEN